MSKLTIATVNSTIARLGIKAELVRGNGYFYFTGPAVRRAPSCSVMVYKISQLTEAQWIDELRRCTDAHEERSDV